MRSTSVIPAAPKVFDLAAFSEGSKLETVNLNLVRFVLALLPNKQLKNFELHFCDAKLVLYFVQEDAGARMMSLRVN